MMLTAYDHNQSLGFLAGLVSRLFNNALISGFQDAGIDMTPEQWGVIIVLVNNGAMNQEELSKQLTLEKSSLSRLVGGLEKRRWVKRTKSDADARKKLVLLTPAAIKMAAECSIIAEKVLSDSVRGMSDLDILLYKHLQARIIGNIKGSHE